MVGHPFAFCATTTEAEKPYLCTAASEATRREWLAALQHNIRVRQAFERRVALWRAASAAADASGVAGRFSLTSGQSTALTIGWADAAPNFGGAPAALDA